MISAAQKNPIDPAGDVASDDYERRRQAALDRYRILDTDAEVAFDDLAKLASTICGTSSAVISLVDRDRQWFKARVGCARTGTARSESLCDHAIRSPRSVMEVRDLRRDPRFAGFASVREDGTVFYAGAPILSADGYPIGTICVFDASPRTLDDGQRQALAALARQVQHLMALRNLLGEQDSQIRDAERDRDELERKHENLRQLARHDPLTGLLNRVALNELMSRPDVRDWMRQNDYGLLLLDLDHFKKINDRYGHLHGDEVLRAVADVVRASIRTGDFALRYGGEEVLIILPSTPSAGIREVAHRIRRRIGGLQLGHPLTVSMGMAMGNAGSDPREVFKRADQALYRAKAWGRDQLASDTD